MAAVMAVDRLEGLLRDAAGEGCRLAWVQDGALLFVPQLGQARFKVDFARETLTKIAAGGREEPAPATEGARRRAAPMAGRRRGSTRSRARAADAPATSPSS